MLYISLQLGKSIFLLTRPKLDNVTKMTNINNFFTTNKGKVCLERA